MITLAEIVTTEADKTWNRDVIVPASALMFKTVFDEELRLKVNTERATEISETGFIEYPTMNLAPNDWALRQIGNKLGITPKAIMSLLQSDPDTLTRSLNYLLSDSIEGGKEFLIRIGKNHQLRAFLSEDYARVANADVASHLSKAVRRGEVDCKTVKTYRSDDNGDFFTVRLVGNVKLDVPDIYGSTIYFGISVTNSETGMSRLKVCPFYHRQQCGNDTTFIGKFSSVHRGDDMSKVFIEKAVLEAVKKIDTMVDLVKRISKVSILDIPAEIRKIAASFSLGRSYVPRIQEAFEAYPVKTLLGLSQAISAVAQSEKTERARAKLEDIAGSVADRWHPKKGGKL